MEVWSPWLYWNEVYNQSKSYSRIVGHWNIVTGINTVLFFIHTYTCIAGMLNKWVHIPRATGASSLLLNLMQQGLHQCLTSLLYTNIRIWYSTESQFIFWFDVIHGNRLNLTLDIGKGNQQLWYKHNYLRITRMRIAISFCSCLHCSNVRIICESINSHD